MPSSVPCPPSIVGNASITVHPERMDNHFVLLETGHHEAEAGVISFELKTAWRASSSACGAAFTCGSRSDAAGERRTAAVAGVGVRSTFSSRPSLLWSMYCRRMMVRTS